MESVLIVSNTEKSTAALLEILTQFQKSYGKITTSAGGQEARRLFSEQVFDLCIVNTPLPDEFGTELAEYFSAKGAAQTILIVRSELYERISEKAGQIGVFTVAKPFTREAFRSALNLAGAAHNRIARLAEENARLTAKLETFRLIDRAKQILIEYLKMTESEAHRYIEKQAMNLRMTKRAVAQDILKTYES